MSHEVRKFVQDVRKATSHLLLEWLLRHELFHLVFRNVAQLVPHTNKRLVELSIPENAPQINGCPTNDGVADRRIGSPFATSHS